VGNSLARQPHHIPPYSSLSLFLSFSLSLEMGPFEAAAAATVAAQGMRARDAAVSADSGNVPLSSPSFSPSFLPAFLFLWRLSKSTKWFERIDDRQRTDGRTEEASSLADQSRCAAAASKFGVR
jgi:hypothetical protein